MAINKSDIVNQLKKSYPNFLKKDIEKLISVVLNEIKRASPDVIENYLFDNQDVTKQALFLFSAIRKLERVGDLCKNIAEQLIFYTEAKVVKHKKVK